MEQPMYTDKKPITQQHLAGVIQALLEDPERLSLVTDAFGLKPGQA